MTQLLGVNDAGLAVGFENDSDGNAHGFVYDTGDNQATFTNIAGATSVTDAAVNDEGQIAGFFTPANGPVESFLTSHQGLEAFAYPGATATQALGLNNHGEVVGVYTTGSGSTAQNFGFTWTKGGFTTISDPAGVGSTTVNGVNDLGDLVGFYVDSNRQHRRHAGDPQPDPGAHQHRQHDDGQHQHHLIGQPLAQGRLVPGPSGTWSLKNATAS